MVLPGEVERSNDRRALVLLSYQRDGRHTTQISGQMKNHDEPLFSEGKWTQDPTELRHAERVRRVLLAYGLETAVDTPFILSVIDGHGLFHPPIPEPKQRSKDIRRAAKAAAKRLDRRILEIRAGQQVAVDDQERRLAEDWERLGRAALQIEEEKIRCGTYQTMRGGRIVPIGEHASRRPELELTHALLMIDYHLEHGKQWSPARRMSCLTDIVIVVQDLHEEATIVAARLTGPITGSEEERIT